jgi:Ca2+-dependent lipid-binding protein
MARNLVVEVISARDLMPKDGQGSANAYCVLDYGGQRNKTRIVHRSLNPTWNEKVKISIHLVSMGI